MTSAVAAGEKNSNDSNTSVSLWNMFDRKTLNGQTAYV